MFAPLALLLSLVIVTMGATTLPEPMTMKEEEMSYLSKYGYMGKEDNSTMTPSKISQALRRMQSFMGLPATGRMDAKTRTFMKKPRCGMPDVGAEIRYGPSSLGRGWGKTHLTWRLVRGTRVRGIRNDVLRRELSRALDVWAKNSPLRFTETNGRADILVTFARGSHADGNAFDGRGAVLAHAYFPGGGIGGDAHFDDDEFWAVNPSRGNQISIFFVAAHEFGHSLGLGHSEDRRALMFPTYQLFPRNFVLPRDDRYRIQALYGRTRGQIRRYGRSAADPVDNTPKN